MKFFSYTNKVRFKIISILGYGTNLGYYISEKKIEKGWNYLLIKDRGYLFDENG